MKKILLIASLLMLTQYVYSQVETYMKYSFKDNTYDVIKIPVNADNLKKFDVLENRSLLPHQDFISIMKSDSASFLINASISDSLCSPIGYYVKSSQQINPVNSKDGAGNFFLKPNGAFIITQNEAVICESSQIQNYQNVILGIQSGPMLLIDGVINSQFKANSVNKNIRCGVGVTASNANEKFIFLCISNEPVSFYDFALFFNKKISCSNALCLESGGCAMLIPNEDAANAKFNGLICNYLYFNRKGASASEKKRLQVQKTSIKMKKINGVYQIPTEIDGIPMSFILDTGAGMISISVTEAGFLYKQGKLTDNDFKGTKNFVDANGDISEGTIINLKTVTLGTRVLTNVEASVVHNLSAPLLMGQSALQRFGKISIDYQKEEITLE